MLRINLSRYFTYSLSVSLYHVHGIYQSVSDLENFQGVLDRSCLPGFQDPDPLHAREGVPRAFRV